MPRCDHCDGQMKKVAPGLYVCNRCGGRRKIGVKKSPTRRY